MKISQIAVALLLSISTAHAQQPQTSPSQIAIQVDTLINQWAQQLENDQRLIASLQKEVADFKAKYEPAQAAPKK